MTNYSTQKTCIDKELSSDLPLNQDIFELRLAKGAVDAAYFDEEESSIMEVSEPQKDIARLINKINHSYVGEKIKVLAEWECSVIEKDEKSFTAKMHDLFDEESPLEIGEFDISDVQAGDRDLIVPGGIFRWMIGRTKSPKGMIQKVSRLHFRRLPTWRSEHFSRAKIASEEMFCEVFADDEI